MALTTLTAVQRDFSAGQITEKATRRDDLKLQRAGLKRAANTRPLAAGGLAQRFGRSAYDLDTGRTEIVRLSDTQQFEFLFGEQVLRIRDAAGTVVGEFADMPWTLATIEQVVIARADREVVITYAGEHPKYLYLGTTSLTETEWTLADYGFDQSSSGAKRQPYLRYAPKGIAVTCSGRSGTIDIVFDADVLDDEHVGVSFRYHEREFVIASVTNARLGTATVIEMLPPTRRVTCDSAANRDSFRTGEVVEGATSGTVGLIVGFHGSTDVDVIVYKNDNFQAGEVIGSPSGSAAVTGTPSEITLAPSVVWDEAAMNDYRGWPRSVVYDRSRLTFSDFPQSPRAIAWSAVGAIQDLAVGADATSGFLEFSDGSGRVLHVIGGADQFIITDVGVSYIPISEANPLRPGSVVFRPIAAFGAAAVRPVAMQEGIVYVAANTKALIGIIPTGQTTAPYRAVGISDFHAELFTSAVVALAAMAGGGAEAEQYLWVLLADGTALTGKFDSSNNWVGFVPVNGLGTIKWITALGADVRFNVQYIDDGDIPWVMEAMDEAQYVDCAVPINADDPTLRPSPEDGSGRLWFLAGLDVALMNGATYLGTRTVDASGDIVEEEGDDFSSASVVAGLAFDLDLSPWIPNEGEGPDRGQRRRLRRVKHAVATVQAATTFTLMGRSFGTVTPGDGTYRAPGQGRSYDPDVPLTKSTPGPLTLIELMTVVTT